MNFLRNQNMNQNANTNQNANQNTNMNRRQFFAALGVASAAAVTVPSLLFAQNSEISVDPNHLVILSDTHCSPTCRHQLDFMRQNVAYILSLNPRPAHVLIYGDFAFLYGKKEDYVLLKELLNPLDAANIPWTTCMGNHDRRDTFAEVFPEHAAKSLLSDRLVFRVETPLVDFLMLDSLIQWKDSSRWITPGEILPEQKEWLDAALKTQTKSVIVGAHHGLDETKIADVLGAHSCVAGYIHGHNHYWKTSEFEGIRSLTLPSAGHWGDIGYVNARISESAASFTLTMRDYVLGNKGPDYEPNPDREKKIAEKQGAVWRLDLKTQN